MKLVSATGGNFTCCKLANLCQNFVTESRANNVLKLPGVDYVAKNWALAMMLKALPLVHFWSNMLLLKEQIMMASVRKTLKTLAWKVQNRSISSEICPENNHKIRHSFTDCFPAKFAPKVPTKSADFSAILSLKIPQNLTFFPRPIRSPGYQTVCVKISLCLGKVNSWDYHFESKRLFVRHMWVVVTKNIFTVNIYMAVKSLPANPLSAMYNFCLHVRHKNVCILERVQLHFCFY